MSNPKTWIYPINGTHYHVHNKFTIYFKKMHLAQTGQVKLTSDMVKKLDPGGKPNSVLTEFDITQLKFQRVDDKGKWEFRSKKPVAAISFYPKDQKLFKCRKGVANFTIYYDKDKKVFFHLTRVNFMEPYHEQEFEYKSMAGLKEFLAG